MKILNRFIISTIVASLSILFAQGSGSLSGSITDSRNDEVLIGTNVMVVGTSFGAATDLNGSFYIPNIPEGFYTIRIGYIGYEDKIVSPVEINEGITNRLDIKLSPSVVRVDSVKVAGKRGASGAMGEISNRKKSDNFQSSISAEELAKTGDSNAADALRRMAGVSVKDGKYAVIRGLADRYITTELNGGPVPSPEPDKSVVPLDMFPTALLESIVILKTYTPDLPGTFAGGNINIKTKAYPDKKILQFKLSLSDKSYLHGNHNYLKSSGSTNDFIGFDDGSRSFPNELANDQVLSTAAIYRPDNMNIVQWYDYLGNAFTQFDKDFTMKSFSPNKPMSLGVYSGNKYEPFRKLELGYFANLNFSNDITYRQFETNQWAFASQNGNGGETLGAYTHRDNERTDLKTSLSGNLSFGLNYNEKHKIKIQNLYTHSSSDWTTYSVGYTPNIEEGVFIKQHYIEKSINNTTISGISILPGLDNHLIEWNYNIGRSKRYEPDMRTHNYSAETHTNDDGSESTVYVLDIQGGKGAYREFTDGIDNNNSLDFNYKLELARRNGMNMKVKTGFRLQAKDRKFEKRSLAITNSSSIAWSKDVLETNEDEDFGSTFDPENAFHIDENGQLHHGLILVDETSKNAFNGYKANEDINAGYLLVDYPISIGGRNIFKSLRILGGLRYEDYVMNLETYNPVTGQPATTVYGDTANAKLDQSDILSSLNLILDTTNDIKLRMAFSSTLGRPQFRELAPIAYQEFYNGEVAIGFPYLNTSSINNYDMRLEWYPSAAELLSIGLFAKEFTNPIETALIITPDLTYKTFQNAKSAQAYGIELEARKRIPFIPINIGNGFISANATFASSEVVSNPEVTLYNGTVYGNAASNTKRPMQGQSDFMLNTAIDLNFTNNYSATLSYNTFSKKISAIGTGVLGDEYEFPFHSLNFTASKKFGPIKLSLKAKNILDSDITFGLIDAGTDEIKVKNSYKPGRSISIGIAYNNL